MLHFCSDSYREGGDIKKREGTNAGLALEEILPGGRYRMPEWRYEPHSCYYNSSSHGLNLIKAAVRMYMPGVLIVPPQTSSLHVV